MDSKFSTIILFIICLPQANSTVYKYPAVFNFGDSNSDTGNLVAGLGVPCNPPNGNMYFQKPSGRFCDGRLIIDFLVDAMNLPYLNPYLDSVGAPDFRHGCNFAVARSTIRYSPNPFSFGVQVAQFLIFKAKVHHLQAKSTKFHNYLPAQHYFKESLYTFDIGQNDLAGGFFFLKLDQIIAGIPLILSDFEEGITKLYEQGARNFWIHNTGPLGCLPRNVAIFGKDPLNLDEFGCVKSQNQASKYFNRQLYALCKKLQGQYKDAKVTYIDIFAIKSNLIANYSTKGFEMPLTTSCGYGGPPLNYDSRINCGESRVLNGSLVTAKSFNDGKKYVNWDGTHYTEAANEYIASQILLGKHSHFH